MNLTSTNSINKATSGINLCFIGKVASLSVNLRTFFVLVFIGFFFHSAYSLEHLSDTCLITSSWGQDWPYNKYCPIEPQASKNLNGHTPIGCVAVAMSQVMRYYKYPSTGTGSISYLSAYGNITSDFSKSNYNWLQMPQTLNATSDSAAIAYTARMMYDCAVSLQMNFGKVMSGTTTPNLFYAFQDYFSYSPNIWVYQKVSQSKAKWDTIICNEINLGRPVIYLTKDSISNIRHAIVFDNYKLGQDLKYRYHCNWGWDGLFNGFYPLDSLYANAGHYGNDSDEIVVRISPPKLLSPKNLRYRFTTDTIGSFAQADTFILLEWDPITDPKLAGFQVVLWTDANRKNKSNERPPVNPLSTAYHPNFMAITFNDTLIYAVQSVDKDSISSLYSNIVMITADDINRQLPAKWPIKHNATAHFSMQFISSKNQIEISCYPSSQSSSTRHLKLELFNCNGIFVNNLFNSEVTPGRYLFPLSQSHNSNGFFIIKASLDNTVSFLKIAKIK
jgi:hypothetical protein